MAVRARSGADGSSIALGVQTAYGTPVTANADMINAFFPVSAIDIDEDADIEESNLITAYGSAGPVEHGQLWLTGGFTTRLLYTGLHRILQGIIVPLISGTTSVDLTGGALGTMTAGAITIGNTGVQPPAGTGNDGAPAGWPSKVVFASGITGNSVVIKGLRRGGRSTGVADRLATFAQQETLDLSGGGGTSDKFYDTVYSITGASGDGAITWDPDTHKTEIEFQLTDPDFPGWTGLIMKGGTPNLATDMIPSEMTVSASSTGIDLTMTVIGTRFDELRTVAGGILTEKTALDTADTTYFKNPPLTAFPGWAGALLFGDAVVKYTSIDFGVNRNLEPEPGVDGRKFKTGASATANRVVTFTPTSYLRAGDTTDVFPRFQELFRNDARQPLIMRNLGYDGDGRQHRMDWETPTAQITSAPRTAVSGPAEIERPLSFQALPGSGTPELKITIYSENALNWTNTLIS